MTEKAGRTYAGLSPKERKAQRKQQFLSAGLSLFGSAGYRATTVRAICKEAKLTDRYFYEAFGSLEALVSAVYEHCMTDLSKQVIQSIAQAYNSGEAEHAIETGLNTYFQILEDCHIARICMVELEGISPEVDALYNTYIDSFANILIYLADKAYPEWQVPETEKKVLAVSLIGALRQSTTNWLVNGYETDRATMVSATMKLFKGLMLLFKA